MYVTLYFTPGCAVVLLNVSLTTGVLVGGNGALAVVSWWIFIKTMGYVCRRGDLSAERENYGYFDVFGRKAGLFFRRVFCPTGR